MKTKRNVILIIFLIIVIITGFLLLFLSEHQSVPRAYSSVRYLTPVSKSKQESIQRSLDNFWQEYTFQNSSQGQVKDSASTPK